MTRFRFTWSPGEQPHGMGINPKTIEQAELDLETARGQFATLQLSAEVSDDVKLLAASIAQAGAEVALAIGQGGSGRSSE